MRQAIFVFQSESLGETDRLGTAIGQLLQPGTVIGLNGTLGAGKTRLTQAIGSTLEIERDNIVSPTFTICIPHYGRLTMLHLDAYRLGGPEEVDELGLDEWIAEGAVLVAEWSDRIAGLLPPIDMEIAIELLGQQSRQFTLRARSEAGDQLVESVRALLV